MALSSSQPEWQRLVARTARLARKAYIVRGFCAGWFWGALVASVLLVLSWSFSWNITLPYILASIVVATVVGAVYGASRPLTEQAVAAWLDQQMGLQERMSTATWIAGEVSEPSPLAALQLQDAEHHATAFAGKRIARIQLPRTLWAALLLSGVAILLWFAPDISWLQSPQTRQQKQAIRAAGVQMEQLAKEWSRQEQSQQSHEMRRLTERMEALAKQMQRARMTPREAMLQLSRLQREAERQQRLLTQTESAKSLQRARDQFLSARAVQQQLLQAKQEHQQTARLQPTAHQQSVPFSQQVTQQMAIALSQQDLQRMGELLQQVAEEWNKLSPKEQRQLEQMLRELAEALKDTELQDVAKEIECTLRHLQEGQQQQAVRCMEGACRACLAASKAKQDAEQWARIAAAISGLKEQVASSSPQKSFQARGSSSNLASTAPKHNQLEYRPQRNEDTTRLLPPRGNLQRLRGVPQLTPNDQPLYVTRGAPDVAPSIIAEKEVYLRYRQAAERAIQREMIPPEYRQPVQQYFDALRPR